MSDPVAKLPAPCERCHCLSGRVGGDAVVCAECGTHRMPVSEKTRQFLTRIPSMWGAPAEIVFRSSNARDKMDQQDLILSNKYAKDGRSWHQIITGTMNGDDASIDGDAIEAVNETEL